MNYIYTLKSYKCNKHCPYCITKIIKRKEKEDILRLPEYLSNLKGNFDYFILSGNGEPSLYSYEELNFIKSTAEESGKFKDFRIQTSGLLFNQENKLALFSDWLKEITVISGDQSVDKLFYKYKDDYFEIAKKTKRVRCNLTLLLNNIDNLEHLTSELLSYYETVAIKLLDSNNEFIKNNAVPYDKAATIVHRLDSHLGLSFYNGNSGRYVWTHSNKCVTMSFGKEKHHDYIQIEG